MYKHSRTEDGDASSGNLSYVGQKFHEVFQLKQGRYSDLAPAKILEMLKATSLDNAPTQSLLSVVNGILDESIKEVPHRVACLLRKVVQEIERRISTQAEHIKNQNNLIKAREEKYMSRIKLLETLANGTNVETQIATSQLQEVKAEKIKAEEAKRVGFQDACRLKKEKENCDAVIAQLKREIEKTNGMYENSKQIEAETVQSKKALEQRLKETDCLLTESRHKIEQLQALEAQTLQSKDDLEKRLKEIECLLSEARGRNEQLEAYSRLKEQSCNERENKYQALLNYQCQALQELQMSSRFIKSFVLEAHRDWLEEFSSFGIKLKDVTDAAQNYHIVLAENRKLYNEVQDLKGNIRVYCRIRPFLSSQTAAPSIVEYIGEDGALVVSNPLNQGKNGLRTFKLSKIFGPTSTQAEVFLDTRPIIRSILDGYNVCIFAYGQTGSGKTYTMTGPEGSSEDEWGVNYRALNDLFNISLQRKSTFTYEIGVQMVEIYNEQVRDLLLNGGSQKRLGIWSTSQPNGLALPDASLHTVTSTDDVLQLMQIGHTNRAVGATALNDRSSRSHSILTVHVRGKDLKDGSVLRGSLHLVDLAGSERVDRSEATGDRLREAQHINKSLSALGDVIFALAQKSSHVPYRNSKLTQVLQSSLGGQAKTLMFVQLNPDVNSYSESLSTLKFAERVSGVELGAARSSKESKDVKQLMEQVASLKDILAKKDEEIARLQHIRDAGGSSPTVGHENSRAHVLKHSSSSPGLLPGGHKTSNRNSSPFGVKLMGHSEVSLSDTDNWSEYSDKHSEASSQQSAEDNTQHKDQVSQPNCREELGDQSSSDLQHLVLEDEPEGISDISDDAPSFEAENGVMQSEMFVSEDIGPGENNERSKGSYRVPRPPPKAKQVPQSRLSATVSARVASARESSRSARETPSPRKAASQIRDLSNKITKR